MANKENIQLVIEAIDNFSGVLDKLNKSLEKGDVEIKVKVNETSLTSSLNSVISKINGKPPSINLRVDSKEFSKNLKEELSNQNVIVKINQDKFKDSFGSAKKKLIDFVSTIYKVVVEVNKEKFNKSIDSIEAKISKVVGKDRKVNIDTDARKITTKLQNIAGRLDTISKKGFTIDGDIKTGNIEGKIIRLATYINQLNSKDIVPKVDKGISEIVKLSTYMNQLNAKKLNLGVDVDITKAKSGIQAIYMMLQDLKKEKYKIHLDTSDLTNKNAQLKTTVNTLRNLSNSLKTIKSKKVSFDFKASSLGQIVKTMRSLNKELTGVKNNIIINIKVNDGDSITKLREISKLLKDIKSNRNININTRTRGSSGGRGSSEYPRGTFFSGVIQFLGRSSKGFGSFMEAISRVSDNMMAMGGTIGKTGAAFAFIGATMFSAITAFNLSYDAVKQFGDILIQVGNAIYKAFKPGIDLFNQKTKAELALGAGARSMATIDGRQITDEESKSIGRQLTNRAIIDAAKSVFNPSELIDAMQGTMPMLFARGMSAEQAYQVTKGVASVAKLGRLAPNQVLQETRDLAQGSITARTSQVANLLGISNEDIEQYKGDADALYAYLMEKFKEYSKALDEYAKTPIGAFEQLEETIAIAGDSIVSKLAQPFVEVFHTITNSLGSFVDEQGHKLDENGQYLDEYGNKLDAVGEVSYQVSEPLQNFAGALEEIIEYLLQSIDELLEYSGVIEDSKTLAEKFVEVMKFLIDAFVVSIKAIKESAQTVIKFGKAVEFIAVPVLEFLYRMVNLVRIAITGWQDLFTLIGAGTGAVRPEDAFKRLEESEKLRQDLIAENEKGYASTFSEFFKSHGLVQSVTDGALVTAYKDGRQRAEREARNKSSVSTDLGKVQGRGKSDTKNLEKANKDAIKQSQKMLKEKLSELKNALADALEDLKDVLEKNKIAYEEGFMSMKDYFTQKADIERQEAELKLAESMEELSAINESLFDNEYDRLKSLHEVERNIRKYSKEVEKTTRQQKEVARNIAKATTAQNKLLQAYSKMLKQGSVLQNNNVQSSRVSSSSNVVSQSSLQSWASNNGISSDIVEEVVNQAVEKYGENADNYIKMTLAMMTQESGGNQDAISSAGAIGLMQLMPDTASGLGVDPYDWKENIAGGLIYIDELAKQFGWDVEKIIAAYNAGPQAVIDYGGTPPYEETQNHVNIVKGYYDELDSLGTQAVSIVEDTTSSIYDALDIALRQDGYLGQTLENGRVACVEAGTKLGSYYSDAFKQAVERGILNTDVLDEFFDEIGIPSIPWDAGQLNAGDIIFFDGEEQNQHVMLFKGNGMLAGNFSNGNEGAGAVGEESLEDYLNYSGLTPTHIRKTGVYGLSSNFGLGYNNLADLSEELTDISKLPIEIISEVNKVMESLGITDVPIADTTQLAQEYRNAINKLTTDTINLQAEHLSRITGNTEGVLLKLYNDMFNDISKHRSGSDEDRAYLQARAYKFQDDYLDAVKSNIETALEFNLDDIERNAKLRNVDIYSGKYSFKDLTDKYYSYFTDVNNKNGLAGFIKQLEDLFVQYSSRGFLKEAVEIRDRIEEAKKSLYEMFNSWIEQGQKYWDNAEAIFNATDRFTPTQREFAEREFNAYRAQREYADRTEYGNKLQADYTKNIKDLTTLNKLSKFLNKNLKEYAENQERINYLVSDTKRLETLIRENEQLKKIAELTSKMPDYLDDIGKAARDALDEGLVEFLTDGILEADSLKDALLDLAYNVLKAIQQESAKWIVKSLMNGLFGQFDVREEMNQTIPAYLQQGQEIIVAITTGTQQVVNAILGNNQLGMNPNYMMMGQQPPSLGMGNYATPSLGGLGAFSSPWATSLLNQNANQYDFSSFNSVLSGLNNFGTSLNQSTQDVDYFGIGLDDVSSTVSDVANKLQNDFTGASGFDAISMATQQASTTITTSIQTIISTFETQFNTASTLLTTALQNLATQIETISMTMTMIGASKGGVIKLAKGGAVYHNNGLITGPGSSTSDSIPAMLSNGEAVLNAKAVKELGLNFINSVNNGDFTKIKAKLPHFADGGFMGEAYQSTARGMTDFAKNIGSSVTTNNQMNIALVRNEEESLEFFMRSPRGQKILVDFAKGNGRVFSRFNNSF